MFPELEARWHPLWRRLGTRLDWDTLQLFLNDLMGNYCQSHRAYHTPVHLECCMAELDEVRDLAEDPDEIELALWYHDYIYNTRDNQGISNERHSALIARFAMGIGQLDAAFSERVIEDIIATEHIGGASRADTLLLLDIDLSILGRSELQFDEYEKHVRFEYSWVAEEAFRKGRAAILQQFLDRPNIYYTPHFQGKYEEQARKNLLRSLKQLES